MSMNFLFSTPSNVLPLHLKQNFPPIIFFESEGDWIKSSLPFKIFSTLKRSVSEDDKRALGSMKRKKTGQPFNEMKKRFENKRAGIPFNEMKRIVKKQQRRKKDDEPMQYNYQNELTTEGTY